VILKHTSLAPILLILTLRDIYNVEYPSRSLILISEDSPGVLCPSRPYKHEEETFKRGELPGRFMARKLFGWSDKRYDQEY